MMYDLIHCLNIKTIEKLLKNHPQVESVQHNPDTKQFVAKLRNGANFVIIECGEIKNTEYPNFIKFYYSQSTDLKDENILYEFSVRYQELVQNTILAFDVAFDSFLRYRAINNTKSSDA